MYKSYSGTTSGTPAVHDVATDLSRNGESGYVKNTGATNSLTIELSDDGTNYGDTITIAPGDSHLLGRNFLDANRAGRIVVKKIRVSQLVGATTYRVYVD